MCNFFNSSAEHFDKELIEGLVYRFDSGTLKSANKRYTSVKHDFEINFTKEEARIKLLKDVKDIPMFSFNLKPIDSIQEMYSKGTIDIVCIAIEIDEKEVTMNGRPRRALTVADETETSIQVTCWGDEMIQHLKKVEVGTLLLLSQCRVSEYMGRSINASSEPNDMLIFKPSDSLINDRLVKIRDWYKSFESPEKVIENVQKLTVYTNRTNEFVSIAQMKRLSNMQFKEHL